MITSQLTEKALGYKYWKTLAQCINMDKSKEYFLDSPFLFKDIPEFVDADVISESWTYFKSIHTNLATSELKPETLERIEKGANDPIVNFYLTHLESVFKMFMSCVSTNMDKINHDTSMIIRFTFNRVNSEEVMICVTPGCKWWILNLPTDKQKMSNWFDDLIKNNHHGRCVMVSLYKVTHPATFHNQVIEPKNNNQ